MLSGYSTLSQLRYLPKNCAITLNRYTKMNGTNPPKKSLKALIDSLQSPNRKLVLSHLEKHPFLTGKQITKLLCGKLPLQEPLKKEYDRTLKMLERMEKDKQIKNV